MNPTTSSPSGTNPDQPRPVRGRRRRILLWTAGVLLLAIVALGIGAQIAINRAEPVLLDRVVTTLSTRYDSRVELDHFHVSVMRGFEAEGEGLKLFPRRFLASQPLIAIARFRFRVSWTSLFQLPMHVGLVRVEGMAINIPPKDQRMSQSPAPAAAPATPSNRKEAKKSGIQIVVDEVVLQNVRLLIGTSKPGKLPLDFEIGNVTLHSVGAGKPMRFEATLVNPKPIGNIQSNGYFGPFQQESPGDTPVSGAYTFTHADLATFKGIAGILSSTGKYQGPLNQLSVDGEANVPDFRLDTGDRPMPLHTRFHAIVDGTSGDTYLQPVEAKLGKSRFIVNGTVVKARNSLGVQHGHTITLDVAMEDARIEDFLALAVKTDPPVMNGRLRMKARILLPPGEARVTQKLHLNGNFDVSDTYFSNEKVQEKVDLLSRLGLGHPRDPDLRQSPPQPESKAPAEVQGTFSLADSQMQFPDLNFSVPGANIDMAGVYTLDGSKFDFHGKAMLQAHPSQMTTGWKSALLKLADPFFAKQGYGTVIPIQVSGTKSDPHFGLDFGHKTPAEKQRPGTP
jgi:hypothetical protein